MILRRIVLSLACIGALSLSACGFHPREAVALPPELGPIQIVTNDRYSVLDNEIHRAMERGTSVAGLHLTPLVTSPSTGTPQITGPGPIGQTVTVHGVTDQDLTGQVPGVQTPAPNPASGQKFATLHIVSMTWRQDPLSIDAFDVAHEFIITLIVKYSFTAPDGSDLLPLQESRLQRDFEYTDANALGSSSEQNTIRDEMQKDMADTIVRRIGIVLRHYKP